MFRPSAPRPATRAALLAGLGLLSLAPGPAPPWAADREAEAEAQLSRVQGRIRAVTEAVQDAVAKRDRGAARLRGADRELARARTRVEEVRGRRSLSEERQTQLRSDQRRASRELEDERSALLGQLRAAYIAGPEEQLKVLLNSGDPARIGRMLAYDGYLGRARSERVAALRERSARLDAVEEALAAENAQLAALEEERQREAAAFDTARVARQRALAELESKVASRNAELAQLRSDAAAVEDLLARLRAVLEDFDDLDAGQPAGQHRRFEAVRGRLPWPAHGRVLASFGEPRPGGLRWNGLLLETHAGTDIRAPYFGRVLYADWLPGLGLLLILDHGDGFLSLYGNNERLFKAVGDRVRPGEILARSSDGGVRPELYFEIRQGARPLDPRHWLRGKPRP